MPIKKRIIEKSLLKKGFSKVEAPHHRYFHHEIDGQITGISTHTSHGSFNTDIGDNILNMMRRQLRLQSLKQTRDLLECPMSGDDYNNFLRAQGII